MQSKVLAYVGAVLSDIHCGAFDAKQWYHELKHEFLDYIDKLIILDFVVITGDYFNNKISINSEHAKYALRFLRELMQICARKGAKLRIIKGTESHDNAQLEILNIAFRDYENVDFKIYETVASEWLFEDMHVLYIPEEYMADKDEYYKDYFGQSYDMIFGHGLIHEALHFASKQESEVTMSKAPIFKVNELRDICKGPVFFGHVHNTIIAGKFRYVNSFSRWAFGEEEDKGFCMCFYAPEDGEYKVQFIKNKLARHFDTIEIGYDSPAFNRTETEQVEYLIKLATSAVVDFLRLEIDIPEEYENPTLLTKLLNEVFSTHKNIKLKINNNAKIKQKKELEEKINILLERYGFIFAKNLPPEEKIARYIKEKYGRNISLDNLRRYLYERIVS